MLDVLASLRHLLDDIGLHAVAPHPQHRSTQQGVHARVMPQSADSKIHDDACDQRDRHLAAKDRDQLPSVDALRDEHGQHLVGS